MLSVPLWLCSKKRVGHCKLQWFEGLFGYHKQKYTDRFNQLEMMGSMRKWGMCAQVKASILIAVVTTVARQKRRVSRPYLTIEAVSLEPLISNLFR